MLCTLAQFKTRYDVSGTGHDTLITQILTGVSAQLAAEAGRICQGVPALEKTTVTETITIRDDRLKTIILACRPVVLITEIKEALYGEFDDADAMVENDDYQIDKPLGLLHRVACNWLAGNLSVKVTYIGGYTSAGEVVGDGETALPDDIKEAALDQAGFVYQRRMSKGLTSESVQGGSISAYAQDKLLPGVVATMRRYRRLL